MSLPSNRGALIRALTRVVECAGDDTRHNFLRELLAQIAAVTLRSGIADRIGGKDGGSRFNLPHPVNFPPDAVRGLPARMQAFYSRTAGAGALRKAGGRRGCTSPC